MEAVQNIIETRPTQSGKLLKILGVGFGLAVGIGATVGVGILRSPGLIAEQLGSVWLIMLAWTLGGVYCLLGANYLAELATMCTGRNDGIRIWRISTAILLSDYVF